MTNFENESTVTFPRSQNWQLPDRPIEARSNGVYVDRHVTDNATDAHALPIVMMGGIGSHVHSLRALGEQLACDGHDVLRLDVTRSSQIGQRALKMMSLWGDVNLADIATYADLIDETLAAEHIERAYLVGHSFGGIQAEMTALRYPDRVAGLALLNTVGGIAVCPPTFEALQVVSGASREDVNRVARVYGGPFLENPELVADLGINKPRDKETEHAYRLSQSTAVSSLFRVAPMIHRIRQPSLVVTGELDPLVPSPNAAYLKYLLPNSTLRTIGGGHMDVVVDSRPFADAIAEHYSRLG